MRLLDEVRAAAAATARSARFVRVQAAANRGLRDELTTLTCEHSQHGDGRWVLGHLTGRLVNVRQPARLDLYERLTQAARKPLTQLRGCNTLPRWTAEGTLPPGEHAATWVECVERFGWTRYRLLLLQGLLAALQNLRDAGCPRVFLDGSFVTQKEVPGDYDGCWEMQGVDSGGWIQCFST